LFSFEEALNWLFLLRCGCFTGLWLVASRNLAHRVKSIQLYIKIIHLNRVEWYSPSAVSSYLLGISNEITRTVWKLSRDLKIFVW